jgi:prepilin-type N-terminal cleavage/methylation domain-containing protein
MTASTASAWRSKPSLLRGRGGFTLIELMIAMSLGLAIIYVAMAGFRAASQSITVVNQMAIENAIVRSGMSLAMDDTDFWLSYDDPFDVGNQAGRQSLRTAPAMAGGAMRGLPFTSLAKSQAAGSYAYVADTYNPSTPWNACENADGWNPNAWTPSESRAWSWVNLIERVPVSASPSKLQTFGSYYRSASTSTTAPHHWQQRQLDGLNKALGYYGLFDYLPVNTLLSLYAPTATGTWSVSREWCFVNGSAPYYLGNDGRQNGLNFAQDMLSATYSNPFIMPNPRNAAASLVPTTYQRYATGITLSTSDNNNSIGSIEQLLHDGMIQTDWLTAQNEPATWPSLRVSTLRYVLTNSFVCLNRIHWVSPVTGKATEMSFTAFGTTLRGARQQRRRDAAGWADPFIASASSDPNLDTY